MSSTAKPSDPPIRLALTPGEPAGIGPDIAVMLAQQASPVAIACFADPELLRTRAGQLDLPLEIRLLDTPGAARPVGAGVLQVVPIAARVPVVSGRLDAANADYVMACLEQAVDACRAERSTASSRDRSRNPSSTTPDARSPAIPSSWPNAAAPRCRS